ncbi:polysaccharide deacetylase [Calothrix sp. NIES-4071]|nr:polysaccharide deacetylase [Calothrix sp. NIES-4071]BAZ55874.1 polysaccharide deacetylase [Calothrix sp. NIES-4105]
MKIPGISRLRGVVRRVENRLAPSGLILLYHRVTELGSDPWSLCVSPQHFAEHLEVLQKLGVTVPLQQMNHTLQSGKRLERQVVVTFDDGYADNLHNAKPLLERYGIPATIFLTTGYMVQEEEFWWDELDRILLQPGCLPSVLSLSVSGRNYKWELSKDGDYSEQDYQYNRRLNWKKKNISSIRHSIYYSLYKLLYSLPKHERAHLIDQIRIWAGASTQVRPTHCTLTQSQMLELAQGELIEIGAHTITHPFLATLPSQAQQEEITSSKTLLEEILERRITSFAYPHGNFGSETKTIVQEAGFSCACSTTTGNVRKNSDRYALPRVVVEDWDGDEFARRLSVYGFVGAGSQIS